MNLTTEELNRLDVDDEKRAKIAALIDGSADPDDFESVQKWVRQCYNEPSDGDKVMCALNELLGGFGVEGITPDGEMEAVADYVNMGDTYDATIVREIGTFGGDKYLVTSWGEWFEAWETENRQDDGEE